MQTSQLKAAEVYSFVSAPVWIRCESGQLWISHDGEDVVLARGEKYLASGNDRIVIEALQDSHFNTLKASNTETTPVKNTARLSQLAAAH